jgi:hypothetical protein
MTAFQLTFHQDPSEEGAKSYDGIQGVLGQCVAEAVAMGYTEAYISDEELNYNMITLFKKGNDDSSFATIELV